MKFPMVSIGALALGAGLAPASLPAWQFTEVSEAVGAAYLHAFTPTGGDSDFGVMSGGVASADYDRDGDIDLYLVTGDLAPNVLLQNDGTGHFTDVAAAAGVALPGHLGSGPAFADLDADGHLDLVVGGIAGSGYRVFRNRGDGSFDDVTPSSGIAAPIPLQNDYSTGIGDPDGDGDLDLFISHWGASGPVNHLWLNMGTGRFVPADDLYGIFAYDLQDWSFSPIFSDIDNDGRQDLLVAGDFGTSQVFRNQGGNAFVRTTKPSVISDENGMGSVAADLDNDGDVDWFVTSIWDPDADPAIPLWGTTGNRLYRNDGAGSFTDVTDEAGVRVGHWGWGACAADFNNDGWLDLFHVNGFPTRHLGVTSFDEDPSRLFINQGNGSFTPAAEDLGINDTGQGRGVSCLDADNDGDIDLFVANNDGMSRLYRNDLDDNPGWLQVRLRGPAANPQAIGAVVTLEAGGVTQRREVSIASNYVSHNPLLQHFGLGAAQQVDRLHVRWPGGGETEWLGVAPNQRVELSAEAHASPAPYAIEPGISGAWYDPSRNGEGFVMEMLPGNVAVAYWFTYDKAGEQDWYIMVGEQRGNRVLFEDVYRVSGGEFGPGFDPGKIEETPVGSAAFTWSDCMHGSMDWQVDGEHGRMQLARITSVMGLGCPVGAPVPEQPEHRFSGSWYDPGHAGEGFVLEVLSNGALLVYWFTFDPEGKRRWFLGVGEAVNGDLVFPDMLTTRGPSFGAEYDPALFEEISWGELTLDIGCDGGPAVYDAIEQGFGSGQLDVVRLTALAGLVCP